MKKILGIAVILSFFCFGFFVHRVEAATCGTGYVSVSCQKLMTGYTYNSYNELIDTWQYWVTDTCCKQVGSGCMQCVDGDLACYSYCPPTTGGGGGGGGGGAVATPTPGPSPTPTPMSVGTVQARAVIVPTTTTICTDVNASTTYLAGNFSLSGVADNPKTTVADGTYATWLNAPANALGTGYFLTPSISSAYVFKLACWDRDNPVGNGTGTFSSLSANGSTLMWNVGYALGPPWVQVNGGDVYVAGALQSYIQPAAAPRVFVTSGVSGYPGVVTYGTSYDLDAAMSDQGASYVSSTNWIANATRNSVDYYDYFYRRYSSPTVTDNASFINLAAVTQPASRATPYYIDGDMTTSGDWSIGNGESVVFIVTGNLTIGGKINLTGTGFVSFIVKGNIAVSSSVGTTDSSITPLVEGIYVTSPTGVFQTGSSTAAGSARFVGKGIFIAGDFLLGRDLENYGGNSVNSAELFFYNPQLLMTMPDAMKELPVIWQEVAP